MIGERSQVSGVGVTGYIRLFPSAWHPKKRERGMRERRPRIGITMRIELETDRFYLSRHYSEAVEAAGASPLHISLIPDEDYIRSVMEEVEGVLLPGSDSDVDPLRYGEEPHTRLGSVHPLKDETDALVLREVERRATPLLAICFGMQILNVSRGGKLIQDIGSALPEAIKHQQGAPRDRLSHRVRLLEGSLMNELAGGDTALVNSHHHQAISEVGRDLVATAWSADGLVEALEDPRGDRFALAVQWHPEIAWARDDLSRAIFARFVEAAYEYAGRRRLSERGLEGEASPRPITSG
jgi:putative glutamine amidotransferase